MALLLLIGLAGPVAADDAPRATPTPTSPSPAPAGLAGPAGYVDAVHRVFLGRGATPVELIRWVPTIEAGDRDALTHALAITDEWAGARVDELYVRILGRPTEPGGRGYWVARIAEGHTVEAIATFLFASDEYFVRAGATDARFVDGLFADLLRRPADDGGRSFWLRQLGAGRTRSEVAKAFYDSMESRRDRVQVLFSGVLGRGPDPSGHGYWADQVLTVGDVALAAFLASSDEFYVRTAGEAPPATLGRGRGTGFQPYATTGGIALHHPAAVVALVGFHQSSHDGGQGQWAVPGRVGSVVMPSRGRGTGRTTAADIPVPPDTEIRSPVTGTVLEAHTYALYCRYRDDRLVIAPDEHPGWEVVVLHIDGVSVAPGDRVVAGVTPIAPRSTVLPFASQVDRYVPSPSWPHVHIEVVDPSIPDRPSGGC